MCPEVTIVIPVFNRAEYIQQCLESVLKQSFGDIEVICIDDGSTDASEDILKEVSRVDPRVRLIMNGHNLGAAASRNAGIQNARGRFIRFVDADDLLPLRSTEVLYRRAVATGADLVRGSLALFADNDLTNFKKIVTVPNRWQTTLSAEKTLWVPWWFTSFIMSTELIGKNRLTYPNLRLGEDPVFLATALVCAKQVSLLEDVVYLYRKYSKSTGSAGTTAADVVDTLKSSAMIKALFLDCHPECWHLGYGPFTAAHFRKFVLKCQLDATQRDFFSGEAEKIWGSSG